MPPRRHLSAPDVARLVTLVQEGYRYRQVGERLDVSASVVSRTYNRFLETNGYERRAGQGRHRATTRRDDRAIIRQALQDPFVPANVISRTFPNRQQQRQQQQQRQRRQPRNISQSTVRNRLRESGLRARTAARGPMLTVAHRRARLQYARDHVNWSMRNWNNVFFSDESRFCLYGNDRRPRAWRRTGQRYEQRFIRPIAAYGGGSVMVWAAISRDSRTPLVIVRDTLNARRYIDRILRPHVLPLTRNRRRFIFMQDNARPHTANITRRFFQRNNITLLRHPAMSPDLNPIEHAWDILGRRLRQNYPNLNNLPALEDALIRVWRQIPQRMIRNCISNMRERLQAVIRSRGGNTRY